ncbi:DUF3761 domain-containing protein [Silvimonas sp. JCM 19000]
MKHCIVALLMALSMLPGWARISVEKASGPAADTVIEQGTYINKAGHVVHKPAHTIGGSAPAGATAHCGDNTYSFSQNRRGTCSHHGGVADWLVN